ncbi:iron-sulfur cluster carrier protein MrpORP [Candidatus Latescibacterota bacterium]
MNNEKQMENEAIKSRIDRVKNIVLVLSGKGGVGKSTVAVNLSAELARQGQRVGLLDVDIHGPSIPGMFGLDDEEVHSDGEEIVPVVFSENLSLISVGFLIKDKNEAVIWRGPMKHNIIKQFISDVQWGDLDYLIVDCPPGTGDEPLGVAQLVGKRAEALIVTTPQRVSIDDVRKSITFCRKLDMNILGIIENMSGFVCPHCDNTVNIFDAGGGEKLGIELNVPFLGHVPIDTNIMKACDIGEPFVSANKDSETSKKFKQIVEKILYSDGNTMEVTEEYLIKKDIKMKIAIPLAEGKLAMHFGHCEQFALIEVDESGIVISKDEITPPPHEPGLLPAWLHELGATHIIAGGMGSRAQGLFTQNDIKVIIGAPSLTPEELVSMYVAGKLISGENVCDH